MLYLMFDTWLSQRDMTLSFGLAFILLCIYIVGNWGVGFIWDKFEFYHAESDFGNRRNPIMMDLKRFLKSQSNKQVFISAGRKKRHGE